MFMKFICTVPRVAMWLSFNEDFSITVFIMDADEIMRIECELG